MKTEIKKLIEKYFSQVDENSKLAKETKDLDNALILLNKNDVLLRVIKDLQNIYWGKIRKDSI
jgi:hypothetical protein